MTPRLAPHLLRVEDPPERYAALIAAVRGEGLRAGWLDLPPEAPAPLPEPLEAAARLGVLRAVAVAGDRGVSVKPIKGAPVLRDLLREHFRGCALVLVRGVIDAALLRPDGEGWIVTAPGEAARRFTTGDLAAALRRPRPWGPPLPPPLSKPERKITKKKDRKDKKVRKATR
jgi:hypothetical protein